MTKSPHLTGRGILSVVASLAFPLAVALWIDLRGTNAMETLGRAPVIGWVLRTAIAALIWLYTLPHPGDFSWSWGFAFLLWFLFAAMFALRRKPLSALVLLLLPLMVFWYLSLCVGGAD